MTLDDFSAARKAMVDTQIATAGVTDRRVLSVFRHVPRELFLPDDRRNLSYSDAHHPIGDGRFLAAPAVFARLVQLAGIAETESVLDYGCGTGYSTAVLAGLAREVVGFEPDTAFAATARAHLHTLGLANARIADAEGWDAQILAFDVILVEGAVVDVPWALLERLAMGGRLVCLMRQGPVGLATVYMKTAQGVVSKTWFNATLPVTGLAPGPAEFVF